MLLRRATVYLGDTRGRFRCSEMTRLHAVTPPDSLGALHSWTESETGGARVDCQRSVLRGCGVSVGETYTLSRSVIGVAKEYASLSGWGD